MIEKFCQEHVKLLYLALKNLREKFRGYTAQILLNSKNLILKRFISHIRINYLLLDIDQGFRSAKAVAIIIDQKGFLKLINN